MRIKILKFLTMFAIGGTERQFLHLTRNLNREKFDVQVGCLARKGEMLKDLVPLNVPIAEYGVKTFYSTSMMRWQWRFARDLRRDGVRVVHAYGFYPNIFSILPARIAGCVTIASVRDTGVFTDQIRLKEMLQKTACRIADRVIVNSHAVKNWLVSLGVAESHITIIPNGVVIPSQRSANHDFSIRRHFGIAADVPLVVLISRLNPKKGIEYFLEAARDVRVRFPNARFLIAGDSLFDGTYRPRLERLSEQLGVSDRVIFAGERNDVPAILQEADLCVLPSLTEGLPNSLLEAMSARLPVVATNVGGIPEIVREGETGFLVPCRDPQALSTAMIKLIESPGLARQFGEAGYERVKTHFSLESTVRQTEELYLSCTGA